VRFSGRKRARAAEDIHGADDYRAVRSAVGALEAAPGDFTDALAVLYQAALKLAPEEEKARWRKRLDIVAAGRRVRVSRVPAEVLVGDDLAAVDAARRLLASAEFEHEVEGLEK
jgi:hypothetical protein